MMFEWDSGKSDACYAQRGFDFEYAIHAFLDPRRCAVRDDRFDHGEARYQLLGSIEGRVFCVVFSATSLPSATTPFGSFPPERPTHARRDSMKTTRIKIDTTQATPLPKGRVDYARLDATTPADIRQQQATDDAQAMQQTAQFARSTRQRLGLTQQEFSARIEVPVETIRNWEQGKRSPTGAAKALLRVLSRAPEVALEALAS